MDEGKAKTTKAKKSNGAAPADEQTPPLTVQAILTDEDLFAAGVRKLHLAHPALNSVDLAPLKHISSPKAGGEVMIYEIVPRG